MHGTSRLSLCALLSLSIALGFLVGARSASAQGTAIPETQVLDRIRGAWLGQMAGVAWAAPTEYYDPAQNEERRLRPDEVPVWDPSDINDAFGQDDIYVEIPFLEAMKAQGVNASWYWFGNFFRATGFGVWHGNRGARDNIRNGLPVPDAAHCLFTKHSDDIDWQIEADFAGQTNPGMVNSAIELAWRAGHVIGFGDGVNGGVFVAAMHARAFTASSIPNIGIAEIVEAGRQSLPTGSEYRQIVEEVLDCHQRGYTWEQTWEQIEAHWRDTDHCPDGVGSFFNIDAKLNGAYVLMGLLFGDGDFEESMRITMMCGQDSDCNTSTVGGILGNYYGFSAIPNKWKSALDTGVRRFSSSQYTFNGAVALNTELASQAVILGGGSVDSSAGIWTLPDQGTTQPPILEQWQDSPESHPKPVLSASAAAPNGREVTFSASATDPHGIKAYQWFFGDLTYANGASVTHTYLQDGVYEAIAYVTDNLGNTAWKSVQVNVGNQPVIVTIDDVHPGWVWDPAWPLYQDVGALGGRARGDLESKAIGKGGQYTFFGTGVEVYTYKGFDGGTLRIWIDGIDRGTYSLYFPPFVQPGPNGPYEVKLELRHQKLCAFSGLANARHTIRIEAVDSHDPARTPWAMIDYLRITTLPNTALLGTCASPAANVNLSSEGTSDWAHWGLVDTSSFNHKRCGAQQISNASLISIGNGVVRRYGDNPNGYTWTDGTPTLSASNTTTGIWVADLHNGLRFTVPADTSERALKVYVGVWKAKGRLEARLSDMSAPAFIDTGLEDCYDTTNRIFTITYRAASAGQNLEVTLLADGVFDLEYGNVTLQAATLVSSVGPTAIPVGAIVPFDSDGAIPSGWTQFTSANGRYIVGAGGAYAAGGTGGGGVVVVRTTTNGDHTGNDDWSGMGNGPWGTKIQGGVAGGHAHNISVAPSLGSRQLRFVRASMQQDAFPSNALVLATQNLSGLSGAYAGDSRYLVPANARTATGTSLGAAGCSTEGAHSHAFPGGNYPDWSWVEYPCYDEGPEGNHTHPAIVSLVSENTRKAYVTAWTNASAAFAASSGMIVMYDSLCPPPGWVICDGTNGTVDLRDYFVFLGPAASQGTRSGNNTLTLADTISSVPWTHDHISWCAWAAPTSWSSFKHNSGSFPHAHDLGNHNPAYQPPYYALVFIQKQ
jgi:chitodextrinase